MSYEKLKSRDLLSMIHSDHPKTASVLIELDRPMPTVEVRRDVRQDRRVWTPTRVSPPDGLDDQERVVNEAREKLTAILGQAPHWLGAAGAFVATVGGEELQKIAELPTVSAIWLNREHRMQLAETP